MRVTNTLEYIRSKKKGIMMVEQSVTVIMASYARDSGFSRLDSTPGGGDLMGMFRSIATAVRFWLWATAS